MIDRLSWRVHDPNLTHQSLGLGPRCKLRYPGGINATTAGGCDPGDHPRSRVLARKCTRKRCLPRAMSEVKGRPVRGFSTPASRCLHPRGTESVFTDSELLATFSVHERRLTVAFSKYPARRRLPLDSGLGRLVRTFASGGRNVPPRLRDNRNGIDPKYPTPMQPTYKSAAPCSRLFREQAWLRFVQQPTRLATIEPDHPTPTECRMIRGSGHRL